MIWYFCTDTKTSETMLKNFCLYFTSVCMVSYMCSESMMMLSVESCKVFGGHHACQVILLGIQNSKYSFFTEISFIFIERSCVLVGTSTNIVGTQLSHLHSTNQAVLRRSKLYELGGVIWVPKIQVVGGALVECPQNIPSDSYETLGFDSDRSH
jgi:hypothetical protein